MAKNEDGMELDISDELIAERRSEEPGQTPEDMAPWMRLIVGNIDKLNNWIGKLTCFMLLPVIGAMVYEVVARKLFVAPTDWAYDTSRMFAGAMFMLGAGYALMRGVHIRADFLFPKLETPDTSLGRPCLVSLVLFPGDAVFLQGFNRLHHQSVGDMGTHHGHILDGAACSCTDSNAARCALPYASGYRRNAALCLSDERKAPQSRPALLAGLHHRSCTDFCKNILP